MLLIPEKAGGAFSVDLVAEDDSGGVVIIENQLERSNHDHLGKLITYTAFTEAGAAICVVSDPRPSTPVPSHGSTKAPPLTSPC